MQNNKELLYKEYPTQSFVELKFSNKNIFELSQEEALLKYKRNSYIISRIFSNEADVEQDSQTNSQQKEILTDEKVQAFQNSFEEKQLQYRDQIKKLQDKSQLFQKIIEESKNIQNQKQLNDFIENLKDNQFYDQDHPFFCKSSPFYNLITDDQILPVDKQLVGDFQIEQNQDYKIYSYK